MIGGLVAAGILLSLAAVLRLGGASLVRTARADALRDAAAIIPGARRVAGLLDDRDLIIPAINIVHSTLLVATSILGVWALTSVLEGVTLALGLAVLAMTVVLFGDLLPRAIGRARPRAAAYRLAPLLGPAVALGSRAADIIEDDDENGEDHEDENEDEEEFELISSVIEFSETLVREVMVPRTDMVVIDADATASTLVALVDEHGFSRVPVISEGIDDVVGVVIAKDLLSRLVRGDQPSAVSQVMRNVDFVPETKRVSDLLREMQASKSHLAVVVDEYGGTAGLVTIEDLLEELVGEIVDEYDEDELLLEEQEDGTWLVDGRLSVSDLSDVVGVELPDEEWDTVGGLVLGLAGRVPFEGERFETADDLVVTVNRVQGRRVAQVRVARQSIEAELEDSR